MWHLSGVKAMQQKALRIEVAKGEYMYARTRVCLAMRTMDLQRVMVHFILSAPNPKIFFSLKYLFAPV